ncbi:hypothetical protein [Actinacidiphila rubida]|uniref:Uncharacterized protein n=1 Tax=Actinacidiphila rubida TaxID=310780 RepID=A0A1H8LAE6_9ACTN|nr:hypothetical protein [Actinacidiphila rubida]SEO01688.1 hypothetical protein SAMN05216267_1015113 [Actinacidiphila rubida]
MAVENSTQTESNRCACSRYSVLVNVREDDRGDLVWDDELTTGCTATARKTFAQGHDAKLKSHLIKWGAAGYEVRVEDGAMMTTADAVTMARDYGFGDKVAAGIARATAKIQAKADRAAKKAAPAPGDDPQDATAEPQTVTAKVGRWEREGVVDGDTFTYTDSKGETQTTTTFTLV